MAAHTSTLAWKIPWMEEPGRLQSMGLLRVGHDWETSLSLFTFMHWRRKWQPTPVFLPGESQGRGSLVGCRLRGRRVGHDWSDLAAAAAALVITFLPAPLCLDAFVDDSSSGIPGSTTLSTREHSLFSLLLFKHCLKFKIPNILSHPYSLPLVEPRSYDKAINSREMRKSLVFSASILGGMFCLPLSLSVHKHLCRQSSKVKWITKTEITFTQ